MIVSHRHKFIFVRTEKTAGSSLQLALSRLCGPEDLITGTAQLKHQNGWPRWSNWIPSGMGPLRRAFPQACGFHTHASIGQVRRSFGNRLFDSYFKFTIERNPWDRQLSLYCHRKRKANRSAALDFARDMSSSMYRMLHHTRLQNWETYTIDGQVAVDFVIRYENLADDVDHVLQTIGLTETLDLPRQRGSWRENKASYREYYSPQLRDLIGRWYQPEIAAFGYEF